MDSTKPEQITTESVREPNDSSGRVAIENLTFDVSEDALGDDVGPDYYRSWQFMGTVISLCLGLISANFAFTLSANCYPAIIADFGTKTNILWVSLAYTLGIASGIMVLSRLSDIFGRRYFFIGGNLLSLVGCVIAGTAHSLDTVVGGMGLIGLASAVQVNFTMAISELVPNSHRPAWVGGIYFVNIFPLGFGPPIARALLLHTSQKWRWSYYIQTIFAGLTTLGLFICYRPPDFHMLHVRRSRMAQLKRQDYVGFVLFVGGLTIFLMGLSWSQFYAWKSARVIVTLVLGFCSLVAFAFYEIYFKLDKLIPTHLFKSPGFVPMAICASIGTMVAYSMFILWPQQVEILLPGGPIRHGFQSGLVGCAVAFGFLVGGFVVPYIKNHRMFLLGSCVVLTATVGGMAGVQPYGQALSCTMIALAGFSVGLVETASRSLLPMSCPDEDLGAALGALGCLGFTTASIGTAVYSTILSNKAKSIIPKKVAAAALNGGLPASSLPSLFLSMSLPNITEVPSINSTIIGKVHMATLQGYADSYRYVYYAALAFGVPAIVAACFTISYSKFLTPKVARRMKTTKRQNASAQDEEA